MSTRRWSRFAGCSFALAILACCASNSAESAPDSATASAPPSRPALAPLELPAIFGDGMVLQRGPSAPVWGRARAGETVRVQLFGVDAISVCDTQTVANSAGEWRVQLTDLTAGGPFRLEVRGEGERTCTIEDVLVGDVWLGSGQSNMRMNAVACDHFEEARDHADLPSLRIFCEASMPAAEPQWRGSGEWVRCSPATCGSFPGALLWFGMELRERLEVPIGLVDSSVGGSRIEHWISAPPQFASPAVGRYATERDAEFWCFDHDRARRDFLQRRQQWQQTVEVASMRGEPLPQRPRSRAEGHLRHGGVGHLFNAKIAPLCTYGLRGFLWYQGEDNVLNANYYGAQLELLIADWRARWGRGDLPFCWVQLPNFADGRARADWPRIREEMRRALCIANTGMVVAIDVGMSHDIHPTNKLAIGQRLAGWALSEVYGLPEARTSPLFVGHAIQGRRVAVCFAPTYGRLSPIDRNLDWFELAGRDGRWHPARAHVGGRDGQYVVVESDAVPEPVDVRYAWEDDPAVELVNAAGLPATPFTTQD
ncbi:MAG TPA: sialate O-acetylesterase [Planctomycetota bacterium]|nr:sialate O-acetylesterase [Planctomycetota bacterium]